MKIILFLLFPSSIAAQLSKRIDSLVLAQKQLSGVVLVADKGKPIYYKAVGYREFSEQVPLKQTDIFELASVSKQFTAMIIMMLKEKRKLDYDDLVEKYVSIPYKNLTIRNLLTHTSGLPDYQAIMNDHWDKTRVASNKDILEYLNLYAPPKLFNPGEKYEYSNTGYVLLASIAEKASGHDFIELCRQWIFKPLKMASTDIRTLAEKAAIKNFAAGHIFIKEKNQFVRADSFPSSDYTIWLGNRKGPGRISSTAADLLKWDQALYTNKLIKQSTLQEAFRGIKLTDGKITEYGFGWMLPLDTNYGKIVMHTGDNPGYKTQIVRFIDKKKTIIILTNNSFENNDELVKSICKIIMN